MAIVYQKDAGLIQGMNNGFNILSQALMQKAQQKKQQEQFQVINDKIKDKPLTNTLLQEILAEPGGMQYIQHYAPIIAPALKEQAKSQGAKQWLGSAFPGMFDSAAPSSPIQEADMIQANRGSGRPRPSAEEEIRSESSNVPEISGVPNDPPMEDSNRVGPEEQTMYQQGGQEGMGLNPPEETPMSQQQGGFSPTQLTQDQLDILAGSPYAEHRHMANMENQRRVGENKTRTQRQTTLLKLNEPKLAETNESLMNLDQAGMGFERMQELINKEGDTFPSSFTAAMFDLDGEGGLSKLGRSQLSPAAQEFTKIIVNQLKDAKGTFGARLTNLDVSTYLRGLPGLMNSPEGRKRILHQLRTINKINSLYSQSIVNEFEKAGGSDQISYSEAVARAKKSSAKEMAQLKDQFIHPDKKSFSSLPDAALYKGRRIQDESTGEILISDGKTWERGK